MRRREKACELPQHIFQDGGLVAMQWYDVDEKKAFHLNISPRARSVLQSMSIPTIQGIPSPKYLIILGTGLMSRGAPRLVEGASPWRLQHRADSCPHGARGLAYGDQVGYDLSNAITGQVNIFVVLPAN